MLHWNKYVEYVWKYLRIKFIGIVIHIKCKISMKLSRQLCHAFVYFKTKYGMEIRTSWSSIDIENIQIMQNNPMKLLLRLCWMTSTMGCVWIWIYWKHLNFIKIIPRIYLRITCPKNDQFDMRRIGQLNVPTCKTQICDKADWGFEASLWKRLEKCMLQYRLKYVLRSGCWNATCLDTMFEFGGCRSKYVLAMSCTKDPTIC